MYQLIAVKIQRCISVYGLVEWLGPGSLVEHVHTLLTSQWGWASAREEYVVRILKDKYAGQLVRLLVLIGHWFFKSKRWAKCFLKDFMEDSITLQMYFQNLFIYLLK